MKIIFKDTSNKKIFVTEEIKKKRLSICKKCEHHLEWLNLYRCKTCGCIMDAKVTLVKSECPIGKW